MKKMNVVVGTLSDEVFDALDDMFEKIGVNIIEKRYDLLYHRYEIHARVNLQQVYKLRKFVQSHNAEILFLGV